MTTPQLNPPAADRIHETVSVIHDDTWGRDIDAGCSQTFAVTLSDGLIMNVATFHGYLQSWTLDPLDDAGPDEQTIGGDLELGFFDLPAVAELAREIRGAELARDARTASHERLRAWSREHSSEADDELRTGFETAAASLHTLQEDVTEVADAFGRPCQDVRLHLDSDTFDEYQPHMRNRGGVWLLPYAHVPVVRDCSLAVAASVSMQMSREEFDHHAAQRVGVSHQNDRTDIELLW